MDSGYGKLSKISVPRLLHLIYSKNDEAAVLEMVREPARKRFFFKNGLPVAASSNILNEVLGRLLVQKGVISQDDYQRSLEVVLREKKRHGEVLISMGMISREKLDDFLSLQLKERILKVFGWTEGEYRYAVVPRLPANMSEYPHHPAALIIDGIELGFYPDSRAREELRGYLDKKTKLRNALGRYRLEDLSLNLQEKRFLDLFDGTRTLKEILDATALLRHRAVSLALSFINMGLVCAEGLSESFDMLGTGTEALHTIEQTGGDSRLNAEFLFVKAKSALLTRDYGGAVEILKKITDINPLEGEYWAYLGWALYNEDHGGIKEAQALIKDAIDLDNDIDMAWYFLGVLFLEQGDLSWAERAFKTAHAKNPWVSEALVELKRLETAKALDPPADADRRGLYADYFSFSKDPFSPAPGPCPAPLLSEESMCVDRLAQGVEKNAGAMLLTGEEGAGKTTVALDLVWRLSNSRVLCAMLLKPEDKELRLMRTINSELYASTDSQSIRELLISLGSRVSQNAILGGRTLIIIDRAETLTEGCLKLVQYLTRLKALQMILVARPAFIERLKAPEFKELDQRLSTRLTLGPFTPEDTRAFILRRIESASKSGTRSIIIKDSALELLHSQSRGLVSLVNANAARVLALATELRTNVLDRELVELALKRPAGRVPAPVPAAPSVETTAKQEPPPIVMTKGAEAGGAEAERVVPDSGPDAAEAGVDEAEEAPIEPATLFEPPESPLLRADVEQGEPEARTGAVEEAPAAAPPSMEMTAPSARPVPSTQAAQSPAATPARQTPVKGAEEAAAGKGLKRLTLIIILIVLAGLAIGAATGYYYLVQGNGPVSTKGAVPLATTPAPGPLPKEATTPSASPSGAESNPPPADTRGQSAPEGAVNNPGASTGNGASEGNTKNPL